VSVRIFPGHRRAIAYAGGVAVMAAAAIITAPASSTAATNPFQRGPDPTLASIQATTGPFAVSSTTVASSATGGKFGGGTIFFPTDTSQGTFGGVVIAPGFTERQNILSWLGPRLASQGFVIFTIDTNSTGDNPSSRATQMLAALDYLTQTSSARTRVDASRLAVSGHSMGGGGTLEAARTRPSLKAAVPMEPWDQTKDFSAVTVPVMILAAQNDRIAPINQHATRFYGSLSTARPKMYLELAGASHTATNSPNTTFASFDIAWMKRFIDNDTRFTQFLCPTPATSNTISAVNNTCPF
jgi:alpha-beta hydrolase superfamily lysophospholipase